MKTVLISWGTWAMGMYSALHLARIGYTVIVLWRNPEKLRKFSGIKNIIPVEFDFSDKKKITEFSQEKLSVDIVLNFIGWTLYWEDYIGLNELTVDKMNEIFQLNVVYPFTLIKTIHNKMRKNGYIINIWSISYQHDLDNIFYSSSKAYLDKLTIFLSKDPTLIEKNIRTYIVHPGDLTQHEKSEKIFQAILAIINWQASDDARIIVH